MFISKRWGLFLILICLGGFGVYYLQPAQSTPTCYPSQLTPEQRQQYVEFMGAIPESSAALLEFELSTITSKVSSQYKSVCPEKLESIDGTRAKINIRGDVFEFVYEHNWAYSYKLGVKYNDRVVYYAK